LYKEVLACERGIYLQTMSKALEEYQLSTISNISFETCTVAALYR